MVDAPRCRAPTPPHTHTHARTHTHTHTSLRACPQVLALSARERRVLRALPPLAPGQQASSKSAGPRYEWADGLHLLHFQLAQLLHRAGARQQAPDWEEHCAAWGREAG